MKPYFIINRKMLVCSKVKFDKINNNQNIEMIIFNEMKNKLTLIRKPL